jgi:hypothetical protein
MSVEPTVFGMLPAAPTVRPAYGDVTLFTSGMCANLVICASDDMRESALKVGEVNKEQVRELIAALGNSGYHLRCK